MRTHWLECSATMILLVVASCRFPDQSSDSCESNAQLCPKSSKAATSVTCDCRCTIGLSEDTGDNYDGHVSVCLPAELNTEVATGQVRSALTSLESQAFDQRVYRYCSQDVARFLRASIKAPVGLRACAIPLHCECTTKGAVRDSMACHSDCTEVACDHKNCPALLWRHSKLDATACFCSRASSCGSVTPAAERPAMCRDWLAPTDPDKDPADAGAGVTVRQ